MATRAGCRSTWLDTQAVRSLGTWLAKDALGALHSQEAQLETYPFALALARAAMRHGVEVRAGEATDLLGTDGRVTGDTLGPRAGRCSDGDPSQRTVERVRWSVAGLRGPGPTTTGTDRPLSTGRAIAPSRDLPSDGLRAAQGKRRPAHRHDGGGRRIRQQPNTGRPSRDFGGRRPDSASRAR